MGARFEDYVAELLSKLGYRVIEKRLKVKVNDVEVGEVDILAEDSLGNKYAVEVKSGKVDVSGIRQAYTNAKILNAKPMVISRGFSNDSSRVLANELGVNVISLEEAFVLTVDELRSAVEMAIYDVIGELINTVYVLMARSGDLSLREIMRILAECSDWTCVCDRLGSSDESCGDLIGELRNELGIRNASLSKLRTIARIYMILSSRNIT